MHTKKAPRPVTDKERLEAVRKDVEAANHERPDSGDAFVRDPEGGPIVMPDDLAEELAEEYVESATMGGPVAVDQREAESDAEVGGPFLNVSGEEEFADGVDESNPIDAEREPLPTPMRAPRQN